MTQRMHVQFIYRLGVLKSSHTPMLHKLVFMHLLTHLYADGASAYFLLRGPVRKATSWFSSRSSDLLANTGTSSEQEVVRAAQRVSEQHTSHSHHISR